MSCGNKLKQIAIAIHNYHDTHLSLPASQTAAFAGRLNLYTASESELSAARWSIRIAILPFLEMGHLFDRIRQVKFPCGPNPNEWWLVYDVDNTTVTLSAELRSIMTSPISAYWCPSDGVGISKPANYVNPANYWFSAGDNPIILRYPNSTNPNTKIRGPFVPQIYHNLNAISDGTSNTLMVSERCLPEPVPGATTRSVKRAVATGTNSATSGMTATTNPRLTDRTYVLGLYKGDEYLATTTVSGKPGVAGACGHPWHTSFVTVLPPNGPSIYVSQDNYNTMIAPTSYHPGGVNVALMDASGRFIAESIDIGTAITFPNDGNDVAGPSPFGVWGALGSMDGGETIPSFQ